MASEYRDRVGVLSRDDYLLIGLDDAGLLTGDGSNRVAQVRLMIEVDRSDHGDRRGHDVGCVESATHAHFDDRDVDRCIGKHGRMQAR